MLNYLIERVSIKKFSHFSILILDYKKKNYLYGKIISYNTVKKFEKKKNSIIQNKISIKEILIHKIIKINKTYILLTVYKIYYGNLIPIQIYLPSTKRKYIRRLNFHDFTKLINNLISENEEIMKFYNAFKNEFKNDKKKFFEKFLKKFFFLVVKKLKIFSNVNSDNMCDIDGVKGALQENLLMEPILLKKYFYFEIHFSYKDKIFEHFKMVNLYNNYTPSFFIRIGSFRNLKILNFKITLKQFVKFFGEEKKKLYNLSDINKIGKFIYNNFLMVWKKFHNEKIDFFDFMEIKDKIRNISNLHLTKNDNSKIGKYPLLLIQKIFTNHPRQICSILIKKESLLEIKIYNLKNKCSKSYYFHFSLILKKFKTFEYFLKKKMYFEAGRRIFEFIKNKYIFKTIFN